MSKDSVKVKTDSIKVLKGMPGWKYVDDYIKNREISLLRRLRNCKDDDIKTYRGRLKELEEFKGFLKVELLDGSALLDELDLFDERINLSNR